jgi:5-methylcytosine-specific restriction protein A
VALCPVCHRQIHLAVDGERFELLDKLYDENIDGLRGAGLDITKRQLYGFYK